MFMLAKISHLFGKIVIFKNTVLVLFNEKNIIRVCKIKVMGYPATVKQIFYYVIEAGLGVVA